MIGDGSERERLQGLARAADVRLIGYREATSAYVRVFDVVVVPSRYEAFGLVALEVMLGGVPVVATPVGGLVEAVGDAGILIPPDDPPALAEAIIRVADRTDSEMTARAARRARDRFSLEWTAGRTDAVYEHLETGAG